MKTVNRITKAVKTEKMIKYNTSKAKFRFFKNRFSSYILQKKDKTTKGEWKIVNAFADKKPGLNFFQGELRKEQRKDLRSQLAIV